MATVAQTLSREGWRSAATPPSLWPLHILVVDDDETTRFLLSTALGREGHACREAVDGEEALRLLQTQWADVVLCDWEMPGMSGAELCRRMRVGDDIPYAYVILMTGHDEPEYLRGAMEVGADDYQTKPISLDELDARLVLASHGVARRRYGQ